MEEIEKEFVLDERLSADSIVLGNFPLSQLLLINDQQFPWFVLVPRRANISEIYQLSADDRALLMDESCQLSFALSKEFVSTKMNVAALGNVVKQLHVHHVVRYDSDIAWPDPIWGKYPAKNYELEQVEDMKKRVQRLLKTLTLKFIPL